MVYITANYKKMHVLKNANEIFQNLCSLIKNFGAKFYNYGINKCIYNEQVNLIERGIL